MPTNNYKADTNLAYLYSGQNAPYKVDPYIDNYLDNTTFNTNFPIGDYYKAVTNIEITYDPVKSVDLLTKGKQRVYDSTIADDSKTPKCPLNAADATEGADASKPIDVTSTNTFAGDIDRNDINLVVSDNLAGFNNIRMNIINDIDQSITLYGKKLVEKSEYRTSADRTTTGILKTSVTHHDMDVYMSEIIAAICSQFMRTNYSKITPGKNTPTEIPSNTDAVTTNSIKEGDRIRQTALNNLSFFDINYKFVMLFESLRETGKKALYSIVTTTPGFKGVEFITALSSRVNMTSPNNKFKTYYYMLRTIMLDFFKLDAKVFYETDDKIDLFMRKILVDMYIKLCYPMIQYDMLTIMMQRYVENGDFVNARFALMAKCLFCFTMIAKLVEPVQETALTQISIKKDFPSIIQTYIERNNNGDIMFNGYTEDKLKTILLDLHDMSSKVEDTSQKTEIVRKAILDNQLAMRTVLAANEEISKQLKTKYTEYYIVFSLLLALLVACSVLYFINMEDTGMMVAAGVLVSVLVYKLFLMILSFVRKN
jgi:hypothetical protein